VRALESFRFFPALVLHIEVIVVFGLIYRWRTRKLPDAERVGALAFIPLSFLMPVTYALLTPLALFTLDTGSWETRGHEEPAIDDVPEAESATESLGDQLVLTAAETAAITSTGSVARHSHARLPAA